MATKTQQAFQKKSGPQKSGVDMTNVIRLQGMRKSVTAPDAAKPLVAGGNMKTVGKAQAATADKALRTTAVLRREMKRVTAFQGANDNGARQGGTNPRYRVKRKLMNSALNAGLMMFSPVLGLGKQLTDMTGEVFSMHSHAVRPHSTAFHDGYHARAAEPHEYSGTMDALNAFMARGPGFGPAPQKLGSLALEDIETTEMAVTDGDLSMPQTLVQIQALEAAAHRIRESGLGVNTAFARSPVVVTADNDDMPGGGNRALEVDGVRALALQTENPQEKAAERVNLAPKLALVA